MALPKDTVHSQKKTQILTLETQAPIRWNEKEVKVEISQRLSRCMLNG